VPHCSPSKVKTNKPTERPANTRFVMKVVISVPEINRADEKAARMAYAKTEQFSYRISLIVRAIPQVLETSISQER